MNNWDNPSALTSENLTAAANRLKEFMNSDVEFKPQPAIYIVPPTVHLHEHKYWVPYGNIAVLVDEEIEYKFIHRLQGYLRDKRQRVKSPRLYRPWGNSHD